MVDWHTRLEKELIEEFGGTPKEKDGTDGVIDGAPVEVRGAKKDDRFRLNRDTHQELVEEDGTYIFDDVADNQPPRQVEAETVDRMIDGQGWHSDRGYMHTFLDTDDVL